MPFWRSKAIASGGVELPGLTSQSILGTDSAGNIIGGPSLMELGPFDVAGDSHISEYGPTLSDYGIAQKVAGILGAGAFRSCALGGAIHASQDGGNGFLGDGGWAHIGNEFNRQEQSAQRYNSTITQSQAAAVTSYTVTSVTNGLAPIAGEWLVLGQGANTEVIQINQQWAGTSPITFATATTKAHTSADPIYHACRNNGYMAKSGIVFLCAEGANDLGLSGPGAPPSPLTSSWQSGTFGTTIGASVGNAPFIQALRFTIANLRCSVIYADTHPAIVYGANWTSTAATSTASYPPIFTPFNGGNAGNYHNTATNGATLTFSTANDFPGGAVAIFLAVPSAGQGAIWDYSVSGATTVAMTSHAAGSLYDNRLITGIAMNNATVSGNVCGTCFRITGLAAGVNTITLKATTIGTLAAFLGIGIEATVPPLIFCAQTSRIPGYVLGTQTIAGPGSNYNRRTTAATGATVTAGHGTTASDVAFTGGTVALATAGTPSAVNAQINDTITLDKGVIGLEETRRITGFTGSPATSCKVDANFVNAHTAAAMQIGLQNADFVGGGFYNTADTQGAISVPGLAACITEVVGEFDSSVVAVPFDPIINGGAGTADPTISSPPYFYVDGVHYNDRGSGIIAGYVAQQILNHLPSLPNAALATVPNKRTFQGVYNDTGATPATSTINVAFTSGWTNAYSNASYGVTYPRTGFYKDPRTRLIQLRGAVLFPSGGAGGTIFILPPGFRPSALTPIKCYTISSVGAIATTAFTLTVDSAGVVKCQSSIATTSAIVFNGEFYAEA